MGYHLVQGLLAFSRKQRGKLPSRCRLNRILLRVKSLLAYWRGHCIGYRISQALKGGDLLHADSPWMEQVLSNLATNARDCMPRGGVTLTITTEVA